jgi:hypothetical protein
MGESLGWVSVVKKRTQKQDLENKSAQLLRKGKTLNNVQSIDKVQSTKKRQALEAIRSVNEYQPLKQEVKSLKRSHTFEETDWRVRLKERRSKVLK